MTFAAPLDHMRFAIEALGALDPLQKSGAFPELSEDLVGAVLSEAGRFAEEVLAPLDALGDREKSRLENGVVVTPTGFKEAYRRFAADGWMGVSFPADYGGQGLPRLVNVVTQELWSAANMAFSLCPMLTKGAIEGLIAHGTDDLRARYVPKLVSGEWTGTMNLTEPQAGSDVGALKMRAEPQSDGTYKLRGTKIFITWGDNDVVPNIIHLVLARLPDAPPGTRGISLFAVPKILDNGARNDIKTLRLEEKLGIHASPTCVLAYGENEGATAYLVGEANRGMAAMFTTMNDARLGVGLEGLGIAERAFQRALAYAQTRRQGRDATGREKGDSVAIIAHPDVRRMLASMKSRIEAMRLLAYANALAIDLAHVAPDEAAREAARARADLLTPVSKAWCTDLGVEIASLGVQLHGGMGYIEETGAAQHFRDSRIAPIYEGTNGIQAIDLVTRKLPLQGGAVVQLFLREIAENAGKLARDKTVAPLGAALDTAGRALANATAYLQERKDPQDQLAGATAYLELFGTVAGGHYLGLQAAAAAAAQKKAGANAAFYATRIALARFYASQCLPRAESLAASITAGGGELAALDAAALSL